MPIIVLDLLKYVFLAVLYIFMARAVRAVWAELRPVQPQTVAPGRSRSTTRSSGRKSKKGPKRADVVEGGSLKGKSFVLDGELLLGRAERCNVVLDDTYASQIHARIFSRGDTWVVEDMGSTNGTYLNRQKVTSPTELSRGDRIKIGKTVLEMRR
ncbi:MAG: FHA domain-containing protein FhaB/FipA [Actinomycetota bacterium]